MLHIINGCVFARERSLCPINVTAGKKNYAASFDFRKTLKDEITIRRLDIRKERKLQ